MIEASGWVDAVTWLVGRAESQRETFVRVGVAAVRPKDVTSVYLSEGHVYITADGLHRVPCSDLAELLEAHAEAQARTKAQAEAWEPERREERRRRQCKDNAKWALSLVVKDATTIERAVDLLSKLERIAETGE